MNRLNEILSSQQKNNCENLTFKINSIISINAITLDLIEEIDKAGPFGPDSPKPIFVVKNCKIKWLGWTGEGGDNTPLQGGGGGKIPLAPTLNRTLMEYQRQC